MIHHVYANQSNIGDWLSALGIQSLLAPHPVKEHFCDGPFAPPTLAALADVGPDDLLVIGGGGLLMDYFEPFWEGLVSLGDRIRYCLWGVGRCDPKAEPSELDAGLLAAIVSGAELCVVRDALTRQALPPDARPPVPCPSLAAIDPVEVDGWGLLHVANQTTVGDDAHFAIRSVAQQYASRTGRPYRETDNRLNGSEQSLVDSLGLYVDADVVVSSALHGCIVAVALGRPVVAVSGDRKIDAFMAAAGLEDWVLEPDGTDQLPELIALAKEQPAASEFVVRAREANRAVAQEIVGRAGLVGRRSGAAHDGADGHHEVPRSASSKRRDPLRRIRGAVVADGAERVLEAWRSLSGGALTRADATLLRQPGVRATVRTAYRLAAPDGSVDARLVTPAEAIADALVAEHVLPAVPEGRGSRMRGVVPDGGATWVFHDARDLVAFDPHEPLHTVLAARYLAGLHTVTSGNPAVQRALPVHRPDHYRRLVARTRDRLAGDWPDSALPSVAAVVDDVLMRLDAAWSRVERAWADLPQCMVHGAWYPERLGVQASTSGASLAVGGWASAGWGVPAEDLDRVDQEAYWSVARSRWTTSPPDADVLFAFAVVLGSIRVLEGWSDDLHAEWAEYALGESAVEAKRLDVAASELAWW